jgi:chorismate mutase
VDDFITVTLNADENVDKIFSAKQIRNPVQRYGAITVLGRLQTILKQVDFIYFVSRL